MSRRSRTGCLRPAPHASIFGTPHGLTDDHGVALLGSAVLPLPVRAALADTMDLAPDVNRLLAGFRDGLAQTGAVRQLRALHQEVARAGGPARRLHCLYVPDGMLTDPAVLHPYWFGDRFTQWQLKVITRAELAASGLPLFGDARPAGLRPVATEDLQAAVHAEISGYWRRLASRRRPWLRDSWVDFGLITLPRAAAALHPGISLPRAKRSAGLATSASRPRSRCRFGGGETA